MSNLAGEPSTAATGTITHYEFTPKLPTANTTAAVDKQERDVRAQYQKFLREGYWFLYEGKTAIPGISWSMVSGIQDMREQYHKTRSIHEIEVPKGCRANLKIAKYNEMFPDDSIIIWVVQRKQTKKGLGPPIPQPAGPDPDIPECSKGVRIPLLGDPLPRILLNHTDSVNHYPRIDPLNPNKIIQSPEFQKAEEARIRDEERTAEAEKVAVEKRRVAAAKEKKDAAVAAGPSRTSSRTQKPVVKLSSELDRPRTRKSKHQEAAKQAESAQTSEKVKTGENMVIAEKPKVAEEAENNEVVQPEIINEPVAENDVVAQPEILNELDGGNAEAVHPEISGRSVAEKQVEEVEIKEPPTKKQRATRATKKAKSETMLNGIESMTTKSSAKSSGEKRKADEEVEEIASPPKKRTRAKAKSENDTITVHVPAVSAAAATPAPPPKSRRDKKTASAVPQASTSSTAAAAAADVGVPPVQPPRAWYLTQDDNSPPMPKGQKPKSRIVKKCVNCGKESSMAWRNRDTPDRNDCMWCEKRRDKKS